MTAAADNWQRRTRSSTAVGEVAKQIKHLHAGLGEVCGVLGGFLPGRRRFGDARRRRRGRTAGRASPRAAGDPAGCPARPRRSRPDARPGGSGRWRRAQRGSSGEPGTANTSRPASCASRAVIRLPERSAASTTTTPSDSPAMIRLRRGKVPGLRRGAERRLGDHGAALRRCGAAARRSPAGRACRGRRPPPRRSARSAARLMRGGVDAARQAGDHDQRARQVGGQRLGHALAVGRGVAAAHQRPRRGAPAARHRPARRAPAAHRPAAPAAADSRARRRRSAGAPSASTASSSRCRIGGGRDRPAAPTAAGAGQGGQRVQRRGGGRSARAGADR